MQSVPITTEVVSSNLVRGKVMKVYCIQHYVIKCVSDLRQIGGFLRVLLFRPPIKLTVTEILLKVALSTIALTPCVNFICELLCCLLTPEIFFMIQNQD
jgi:hypothetical protein